MSNNPSDRQQQSSSERASGSRVRTSQSHPLRIDEVKAGASGGVIGITFCPGKRGASASDHRWERDLETDLDVIADWRPAAIVTLIEDHEFDMLGVPDLGDRVRCRGIEWRHLPIVDVRPPDSRFEAGWQSSGSNLTGMLRDGKKVLVHCRGGLGRAGMVAAVLLIELGVDSNDAIRSVRAARPGAIETSGQLRYVMDWPHRNRTSE